MRVECLLHIIQATWVPRGCLTTSDGGNRSQLGLLIDKLWPPLLRQVIMFACLYSQGGLPFNHILPAMTPGICIHSMFFGHERGALPLK